jgi:hypothetical protein
MKKHRQVYKKECFTLLIRCYEVGVHTVFLTEAGEVETTNLTRSEFCQRVFIL